MCAMLCHVMCVPMTDSLHGEHSRHSLSLSHLNSESLSCNFRMALVRVRYCTAFPAFPCTGNRECESRGVSLAPVLSCGFCGECLRSLPLGAASCLHAQLCTYTGTILSTRSCSRKRESSQEKHMPVCLTREKAHPLQFPSHLSFGQKIIFKCRNSQFTKWTLFPADWLRPSCGTCTGV